MPYQAMPNAGQNLAQTRDQIRSNIADLKASLAINHVDLDLAPETGKHKFLQMPSQGSAPATLANELGLYVKGAGAATRLWLRQQNNGTEVQLSGVDPTSAATGRTFLPGGILLIWSSFDPTSSINVTFPFSGFPTACFQVQLTGAADNNSTFRNGISTGTISSTGFTWEGTVSSHWTPIYYLAIGN